jgi:hypothetical protein
VKLTNHAGVSYVGVHMCDTCPSSVHVDRCTYIYAVFAGACIVASCFACTCVYMQEYSTCDYKDMCPSHLFLENTTTLSYILYIYIYLELMYKHTQKSNKNMVCNENSPPLIRNWHISSCWLYG